MEMDKTTRALLYLMRCALHNIAPDPIAELDYERLYNLSVSHSVTAMTAMALECGGLLTEDYTTPECIKKWKDAKVKAVRKNILLDAEREEIFLHFEEQGIWYLPLKGSILKDMYPKMGMRQMADNDILFDAAYQYPLKAYMESRGYKTIDFAKENHDVYEKPPVYNFEFHISLINEYLFPELAAYYEDVKPRLKKNEENNFGYHFSDEDFYVYLLVHGYKHYAHNGTGIRFLSDIYVFLRTKGQFLDWEYVKKELETLKIQDFEENTRELAEKLFGDGEAYALVGKEEKILKYLMGAGTYGTVETWVNRQLEEIQKTDGPTTLWTKIRYAWKRLFPDRTFMKAYAPFCREHAWSIPFFRIYRLIKAAIFRRNAIWREVDAIKNNAE